MKVNPQQSKTWVAVSVIVALILISSCLFVLLAAVATHCVGNSTMSMDI